MCTGAFGVNCANDTICRIGQQNDGEPDVCAEWWRGALHEVWGASHPAQQDPFKTVPIMLHGDEGKYTKGRSIMAVSFGTPLVHGFSLDTRWPITVLPSRLMHVDGHNYVTLDELQAFIADSFNKAFAARVQGFRAAYVGTKGDWKFHVQLRPLCGRTPAGDLICFDCQASSKNEALLHTDVSDTAAWITTIATQTTNLPPLAAAVGWHWNSYFADLLHTVWLGIGRDAVGTWPAN